jgi:hypothetical protein
MAYGIVEKQLRDSPSKPDTFRGAVLAYAGWIVIFDLIFACSATSMWITRKLHLEFHPTWPGSFNASYKVRFIFLGMTILFGVIGWKLWRVIKPILLNITTTPAECRRTSVGIGVFVIASFLAVWRVQRSLHLGAAQPFVDGFASALFLSFAMTIMYLFVALRSSSILEKKSATRQVVALIVAMYLCAVSFYSLDWYPRIPQFLGGGKPTSVAIWIDSSQSLASSVLPPSAKCGAQSGEPFTCRRLYLVSMDSDYFIFALDDTPYSQGLVFPKETIAAISRN